MRRSKAGRDPVTGEEIDMELASRVDAEIGDLLATLPLVRENDELVERLFSQLVDLLVESQFAQLREDFAERRITPEGYAVELTALARQCRAVGLLPLGSPRRSGGRRAG